MLWGSLGGLCQLFGGRLLDVSGALTYVLIDVIQEIVHTFNALFCYCFILIEETSAKKRGKINFRAVGTRQQRPRPQLGNCRLGGENKKSRNDKEIILKLIITPSSSRLKLVFYANFPVEVDFFAVKIFIEAITLRHNLKGIIWKFPVRLWPGLSHKLWAA